MRRRLTILVLLLAAPVEAQVTTSYTLTIYAAGTPTVISSATIPAASFVCNQAPVSGVVVNPNKVLFLDPLNAGQDCVYADPGTGPLAALPFSAAGYEATVYATNSAGSSAESGRSLPFTHPGVAPFVVTGVKVIR